VIFSYFSLFATDHARLSGHSGDNYNIDSVLHKKVDTSLGLGDRNLEVHSYGKFSRINWEL
jgi:hypothetical protein